MMITHYEVVMFKTVVAGAFPKNYAVKVRIFWLQNFHIFLNLNVHSWKRMTKKPKKQLFLYVKHCISLLIFLTL